MKVEMAKWYNKHANETAVIIGNGPSLTLEQIDKLSKYVTFGSNAIYDLPYQPTYYSIVDREMLDACLPLPEDFKPTMFLRAEAKVDNNNPIYPIVAGGFSRNIDNFVIMGGTVTYVLMQIAYYMGFTKLLLLGIDHYYPSIPVQPGQSFIAGQDDPNHFKRKDGSPYFSTGKCYNAPEIERTTTTYSWAKEFFALEGRRIINLTPDSKLDVFEKMSIDQWLQYDRQHT